MYPNQEASLTRANPFLWPAMARLAFYNARGKVRLTSKDRRLDLSDTLMMKKNYRTIYMGVASLSPKWISWNEDNVKKIEDQIEYDLTFDGYRVRIERFAGPSDAIPCTQEFRWKLIIRPA